MAEKTIQEDMDEVLWVLTRLMDSTCAIDGRCVEAILVQEGDIIHLPDSDGVHIGMISFRGSFVPVTDLRVLMGMHSHAQELGEFENMLEQRKQDHIRWVDTLKKSIENDQPFPLALDPHQCAFGKWYYQYEPQDSTVSFQLKKIKEPHEKLHYSAQEAIACKREHDEEGLQGALTRAAEEYMPTVVHLLEETKAVYRDSYRKMIVVVTHEETSCALLVDEVLAAEPLISATENCQLGGNEDNPLVTHIAQRKGDDHQILVLNLDRLFAVAAQS